MIVTTRKAVVVLPLLLLSLFLSTALVACAPESRRQAGAYEAASPDVEYFVYASRGADRNLGTQRNRPLKSISAAVEKVRNERRRDKTRGVTRHLSLIHI